MAAQDPIQDPGVVSPPQGDPQPTPAPVVAPVPAEDWEKRFKGMQTAYQALKTQFDTLSGTHNASLQEVQQRQAQIEGLTAQLRDATTALETGSTESDAATQAMAEMQAKLDMHNLIFGEFQDLAPFAAMIPVMAEEEAQRNTLQEWNERISGVVNERVQDGVQAALRGVTPPTSPARTQSPAMGMTDEQLSARMDQILGMPGKEDEANILMAEYFRRQEAQGA